MFDLQQLNFNNQHYLQVDGTSQGPHIISCSYSDIAMYPYDLKSLSYIPAAKCWKHFQDDIVLWEHTRDITDVNPLLSDLNKLIRNRLTLLYSEPRACFLQNF